LIKVPAQAIKNITPVNNTVKISLTQKIVDFFKSRFKKSI
jgi:hypothetical protein